MPRYTNKKTGQVFISPKELSPEQIEEMIALASEPQKPDRFENFGGVKRSQIKPQPAIASSTAEGIRATVPHEEEEPLDEGQLKLLEAAEGLELKYPKPQPQPPQEPTRAFKLLAEKVPIDEPLIKEFLKGAGKFLDLGPRAIMGGEMAMEQELAEAQRILAKQGITGIPEAALRTILGGTHGAFGAMMGTTPIGVGIIGTQEAAADISPEAGEVMSKAMQPVKTTANVLSQMLGIPPSKEEMTGLAGAAADLTDLFGQIYMFNKTHKAVESKGKSARELAFIESQPKFARATPEGTYSETGEYLQEIAAWGKQFQKEFPNLFARINAKLDRKEPLTPGEKNVVNSFTRKMMRNEIPITKDKPPTDEEAIELLQGLEKSNGIRQWNDKQIANMTGEQRLYYATGGRFGSQGKPQIEKPQAIDIVGKEVVPTKPLEVEPAKPEEKITEKITPPVEPVKEEVKPLPEKPATIGEVTETTKAGEIQDYDTGIYSKSEAESKTLGSEIIELQKKIKSKDIGADEKKALMKEFKAKSDRYDQLSQEYVKGRSKIDNQVGDITGKILDEKGFDVKSDADYRDILEGVYDRINEPSRRESSIRKIIEDYVSENQDKFQKEEGPESPTVPTKEKNKTQPPEEKVNPSKSTRMVIYDTPIEGIKKDVDAFQNRDTEYSEESVQKILKAIDDRTFKYERFDPIVLWKNPEDGEMYVLSGHSRLEAFARANKSIAHEGEFGTIPSKIIEGVSKEEAVRIAKQSNVLSTRETPLDRAKYYRELRKSGKSDAEVEEEAKTFEGKGAWNGIINLSYLNPKGKTIDALRMIGEEGDSGRQGRTIAEWVGLVRRIYPDLTDIHETEMFDFLMENFGEQGAAIKNRVQFKELIERVVNQLTGFDYEQKLNLKNFTQKSRNMVEYDAQMEEALKAVNEAKDVLEKKRRDFIKRQGQNPTQYTNEMVDKAIKPYQDAVVVAEREYIQLKMNRDKAFAELNATELDLFNEIDKLEGKLKDEGIDDRRIEQRKGSSSETEVHGGASPKEAPAGGIPGGGAQGEATEKAAEEPTPRKVGKSSPKGSPSASSEPLANEQYMDQFLSPVVKSEFKESDLDDVLTLRQIGKKFAADLNKVPGKDVRSGWGLIKRFNRRAIGLFFPNSGLIRLRNINELDVFAHEVGHEIDLQLFNYSDKIRFNKADAIEKILVMQLGRYKLDPSKRRKLMDNLYAKYGKSTVDAIAHRYNMRKELQEGILAHYPNKKLEEGVAEFVKGYVVDPAKTQVIAPTFHDFFENLLNANPNLKRTFLSAREQFKQYKSQDPRSLYESKIARKAEDGNVWIDGIKKLFGKTGAYYNIMNVLAPIKNLSERLKKLDPNLPGHKDPYAQVLSIFGVEGKQKQFLENHPFRRIGNDVEIMNDVPGLLKIFSKMIQEGTLKSHEGYLSARRDLELIKNKKYAASLLPKHIAEQTVKLYEDQLGKDYLDNLVKDLKSYNDALLEYYYQSGKLSKEAFDELVKIYDVYVPYKRFFDDYESSGGTVNLGKRLTEYSPSPVKKIKGSGREIQSPIESLIKNTYDLLVSSDRNIALDALVAGLRKLDPKLVDVIPPQVVKPVKVLEDGSLELKFALEYKKPENAEVITVWKNGKPTYYQVPKEYYDSFFSVYEPYSKAIRKFAIPTNILRAGAVVYDPTFGFRNIPRDQISGMFYSKYNYNPYHFFKGIFQAVNKTEMYQKFLASGSDLSFLATIDKAVDITQNRVHTQGHLNTIWKRYMHKAGVINLAKDFNRATELGTRVGSWRNAFLQTGDVYKAMEEARTIGADYSIQGAAMKNISPLYAFLNARMRHAENMVQSLGPKHIGKTALKGLTTIVPATVLTWIMNNMDEERRKLYQELPQWRKSLFFNIPIPGTDNFLPVPKGFYGVLFGSIPEAVLDYASSQDTKSMEQLPKSLFNEISPFSSIMDVVPQFGRPIAEQFANKLAYTERSIVPGSMERIAPGEQYTDLTPEFIKEIGKKVGISPARMESFIVGYTAGAGRNSLYVTDEILQLAGIVDKKPEDTFSKLSRMPITRAFVSRTYLGSRSESVQQFYEKLDELEEVNNTVNKLIRDEKVEDLEKYIKENDADYRYYLKNQKEINRFKELIRGVRDLQSEMIRKDDPDRYEKAKEMDWIITSLGQKFNEAYQEGIKFKVGTALSGIGTKHKKEEKEERNKIQRFKNKYKQSQQKEIVE